MELLTTLSDIERHEIEHADSYMAIVAPSNTRASADIPAERLSARQAALRDPHTPFLTDDKPWVGCYYPTAAAAQDAGLPLHAFEDFLYGAALIDWQELRRKMEGIVEHFDAAETVRIVAPETDLTFSLADRKGKVDALGANMPGGEIFYSPVEDSAEGVITFSEYPACYLGHEVGGVRLQFEGGRIVEASAKSDEEFLLGTLDTDEGARRLGEFGIGCNPGIQRHMKNTLFDEKMEGTTISPSAPGSRKSVARTRAASTGTWSRSCGQAGGSSWTAGSSRRTACGRCRSESHRVRTADRRALARRPARVADPDPDTAGGAAADRRADPHDRGAGAYPLLRMNYTLFPCDEPWAAEAPLELVGEIAPIDLYACDQMDARITVEAPDNTRGVTGSAPSGAR